MTDPQHPSSDPANPMPLDQPPSPEELEAAAAANAADAVAQLSNVQAEVEALRAKMAELADQSLRAQAEAQNARRRADDEIVKIRKFAVESFAESLLPVIDSLEAGLKSESATVQQLREGTEATLRQLISALERNKVQEVNPPAGAKFDPATQAAISMVPSDQEPNTIVNVLQKGYTIADRVLRPALVAVAGSK